MLYIHIDISTNNLPLETRTSQMFWEKWVLIIVDNKLQVDNVFYFTIFMSSFFIYVKF